jgi:hypothetical protein
MMQMILNMIGIGVGLSTVDVAAGDTQAPARFASEDTLL